MSRTSTIAATSALSLCAVMLVGFSLFVGPSGLSPAEVLSALTGGDGPASVIVLDLRLPRALLAFLVGAALAGSGAVFQALFRNPLADPFVAGVSGGAALGAVAASVCGVQTGLFGIGAASLAAFAGALGAALLVYRIASARGRIPVAPLLLAGFAVGSFCSALVSILLLLDARNWNEVLVWLMGSFDRPDAWTRIRVSAPVLAIALAVMWIHRRPLNLLLLGEETAQHLGLDVERAKKTLLAAGSISAAVAVSMCGIIGFVGLIVPHVARLLAGPDHRTLLPVSVLAGGAFLVGADILARIAMPPSGVPVGTVTALAGAPFFLLLLRRRMPD